MTKIVQPDEGERHPYRVHLAKTLDTLLADPGAPKAAWVALRLVDTLLADPGAPKAAWVALRLGISEALLSDYRSGRHAIPDYRAALVDELLGTDRMAEARAGIEGFRLVPTTTTDLTAEDLGRLFPQILRAQGAADADIHEALRDQLLNGAERVQIHAHAQALRRFWQRIEESTAGGVV